MARNNQLTDTLDSMIAEDASQQSATPDMLAKITTTAHDLKAAQLKQAQIAAELEKQSNLVKQLEQQTLPSLMDEAGMKSFTLDDGTFLERAEEIYPSISKANKPEACKWMIENGFDALVKNFLNIPLPRGEAKNVKKITTVLRKAKIAFELSHDIHPQTLKAFVRESLEESRELPGTITVHVQPCVKMKVKESKPTTIVNKRRKR
jgi:hypothetical protein